MIDESALQSLLTREERPLTESIVNLDSFFAKVYSYYLAGGWRVMLVNRMIHLVCGESMNYYIFRTLGFTIGFSTFLLLFIDWKEVLKCVDADACVNVQIIRKDALQLYGVVGKMNSCSNSFGSGLVLLYFIVFCVFWIWNLISSYHSLRDGLEMHYFYHNRLKLKDVLFIFLIL